MDELDILDKILNENAEKIKKAETKKKAENFPKKKKIQKIKKVLYRKNKKLPEYCIRKLGSKKWVDKTLTEFDENDFRIWVGNLGKEVTDDHLIIVFKKYNSFLKAKVVKDFKGGSKGYGFVSFKEARDFIKAMKEVQGRYIGRKPVMLKKSEWKKRILSNNKKKKF